MTRPDIGEGRASNHPRVLHVAEVVLGGIATYLDELLQWQGKNLGKENVLLLLPAEHIANLAEQTRAAVTIVPYHRTGRNLASVFRLAIDLHRLAFRFNPAIVHAHSSFAGLVARLPMVVKKADVIFTPNGWSYDREDGRLAQSVYRFAERLMARRAAAIITCSEYEAHSAESVGLPRELIHIIPHGVSEGRLAPQIEGDDGDAECQGTLELLFVGRLDVQKGFDWLIDVLRTIPAEKINLTVVGCKILNAESQEQELPNVCYRGWVSQSELDQYIDACDAVIMPSRWEGFPFVALETLRRARPLLVSDRGALPEMVGYGEAGHIFSLEDPAQLQEMLEKLTRRHLRQFRAAARQRFLQHYTSNLMNQRTLDLYRRVAVHVI
jgi:glycosyltransferase involved in cell wall biosynthesis